MKAFLVTFLVSLSFLSIGTRLPADALKISEATLDASVQKRLGAILSFLKDFYTARDDQPAWTDVENVDAALGIIAASVEDGLNPEDFAYSSLISLSNAGHSTQFDVELTANLVLLGYVLNQGKVDPAFKRFDDYWTRVSSRDPVLELNIALETRQLREAVNRARPQHSYYRALRRALATHREIAGLGGWPRVSDGDVLRIGDTGERVAEVAARLRAGGYLSSALANGKEFSPGLEAATIAFQADHGEEADGVIGKRTIAAMNVSVEDRINQIRVNMERARWLGDIPDSRHIIVNIAGFYAAVMENEAPIWTTRVIVGKHFTQTPVFVDEIEYLEFNPTWTAPRSITVNELAPKIIADPGYLARNDYYLATANGKAVNPRSVNWSSISAQNFPYWVIQKPGEKNSLGRVKFMFPNEHSVYMHDTPSRGLFDRSLRSFSHGCIRTENPLQLAELLLRGQGWDINRITQTIASGRRTSVTLDRRVPVALLYWTVDPTEDGIRFYRDIYDRDNKLLKALNEPLQFN